MTVPSWPELIMLMYFGESEEHPFVGVLEVDRWYREPVVGEPLPDTVRVYTKGARYRVETLDGHVLFIRGTDRTWRFFPGSTSPVLRLLGEREDGVLRELGERPGFGSYQHAIERPPLTSWHVDESAERVAPLGATYLGRDAWEVELPPRPNRASGAQLTIDATTGQQLRCGSDHRDDFRWTELREAPELDDALFTWEGPVVGHDDIDIDFEIPPELLVGEDDLPAPEIDDRDDE
ncbi:MAG: hypothetical protein JWM93_3567 [Frankiales bacterium]|nr:hypothetical protein [Frankiales bacterium]